MKVFLDTNVLVAACVVAHEHHARALPLMRAVHSGEMEGCVSAHSLLEAHAILTRLPRTPRIMPAQAKELIAENVIKYFNVLSLSAKEYTQLIAKLGENGIVGGACYDMLHLECAEKSGAERIFTFNLDDFPRLASHLADRISAP